jgi:hypothetical protein
MAWYDAFAAVDHALGGNPAEDPATPAGSPFSPWELRT